MCEHKRPKPLNLGALGVVSLTDGLVIERTGPDGSKTSNKIRDPLSRAGTPNPTCSGCRNGSCSRHKSPAATSDDDTLPPVLDQTGEF